MSLTGAVESMDMCVRLIVYIFGEIVEIDHTKLVLCKTVQLYALAEFVRLATDDDWYGVLFRHHSDQCRPGSRVHSSV